MMTEEKTPAIILSTTGASVQIVGGSIAFDAKGEIHFHGGTQVQLTNKDGSIVVKGNTFADFDCGGARSPEPAASKVPTAGGPSGGPSLHAPTYPKGKKSKLPPPKGFDEVTVKNAKDETPPPPPPPRRTSARSSDDDGGETSGTSTSPSPSPTASRAPTPTAPSATAPTTAAANAKSAPLTSATGPSAATNALSPTPIGNAVSKPGGSVVNDLVSKGVQQLASGASPLDVVKSAGVSAVSNAAGPMAGEALSRGLQLAAGSSPYDVVRSMAMGELQQAFVKAEMAALPTQTVAKVNAIAQQVVGFVDMKEKAMMLLGGLG
jgi:hypothetical protein